MQQKDMNPSDFIESANRDAATGQPYLFIADFELQKPLLYPATDIPEGIFSHFQVTQTIISRKCHPRTLILNASPLISPIIPNPAGMSSIISTG